MHYINGVFTYQIRKLKSKIRIINSIYLTSDEQESKLNWSDPHLNEFGKWKTNFSRGVGNHSCIPMSGNTILINILIFRK